MRCFDSAATRTYNAMRASHVVCRSLFWVPVFSVAATLCHWKTNCCSQFFACKKGHCKVLVFFLHYSINRPINRLIDASAQNKIRVLTPVSCSCKLLRVFLYIITHSLVAFLSNTDTLWCVSLALIKALMCLWVCCCPPVNITQRLICCLSSKKNLFFELHANRQWTWEAGGSKQDECDSLAAATALPSAYN